MPYVKTINEDGVVSDIMAKAIDPTLDATILKKSNLVNGFTQVDAGVNALDAAAGKTLNDSFANYLPTTDIAATYATKSETLRAIVIRSSVASGQSLNAGDWKDYDTGVTISGTLVAYIAQYSGNPKCIIANMWTSATNTAKVTIYNPSSTAQSLGEIRFLELYKD